MPASAAQIMVAATVVAPVRPVATQAARSARLSFITVPSSDWAKRSSAASSRPMRMVPSITAMVAGTAPPARISASTSRAISRFCGNGIPWVMIVDSSATTGRP